MISGFGYLAYRVISKRNERSFDTSARTLTNDKAVNAATDYCGAADSKAADAA